MIIIIHNENFNKVHLHDYNERPLSILHDTKTY